MIPTHYDPKIKDETSAKLNQVRRIFVLYFNKVVHRFSTMNSLDLICTT